MTAHGQHNFEKVIEDALELSQKKKSKRRQLTAAGNRNHHNNNLSSENEDNAITNIIINNNEQGGDVENNGGIELKKNLIKHFKIKRKKRRLLSPKENSIDRYDVYFKEFKTLIHQLKNSKKK